MLVLTRRVGETLFFELPTGDRIEVAVLENTGSQVRVGIEAPAVYGELAILTCKQKPG